MLALVAGSAAADAALAKTGDATVQFEASGPGGMGRQLLQLAPRRHAVKAWTAKPDGTVLKAMGREPTTGDCNGCHRPGGEADQRIVP